jgi:hypothetical protein
MLEWCWKRRQKRNREVLKLYLLTLANRISNIPGEYYYQQEIKEITDILDCPCLGKYMDLYLTEDRFIGRKYISDNMFMCFIAAFMGGFTAGVFAVVHPVVGCITGIMLIYANYKIRNVMDNHTFTGECVGCYKLFMIKDATKFQLKRLDYMTRGIRRMN